MKVLDDNISNRDKSYMRLAYKHSKSSTHPNHQMAAVVVRRGSIVSFACNHQKWGQHAETRALGRNQAEYKRGDKYFGESKHNGAVIYIVRSSWGCSRPCSMCRAFIRDAGIHAVVYIDENRVLTKEIINGE